MPCLVGGNSTWDLHLQGIKRGNFEIWWELSIPKQNFKMHSITITNWDED